ncbi:wax ester/triacylglycerol synthase family O-acyltransferase [Nocardia cyriacigeorgica]|uniref:wax ester/triacylglycerol synthase family O-acyltransferase n=1 Tax=Nocardia cyriacigeorgica TaxID=135487 RepID=UPI000CE9D984|nr:wax ester/triacylglycerol synthase family O-acyltransferase [Nocardia cyriacigeorgica]PPJ06408.1 wax ester/triacylglycerol synthase family O-acyltransferase [Nocardia cyriacigeorgica]
MNPVRPLRVTAERLHPRDAVFVYDETDRHLSNIVAVYAFAASTPLTYPQVTAWMRARLGLSALFHRRLQRVPMDLDLPYWVPDPILELRDHVFLTAPRTWDDVRRRIATIASARMDLSRPPWELHVMDQVHDVPGLDGAATFVVVKFHHSVGDGVATRKLELALFGDSPPPPSAEVVHAWPTLATALRTTDALTVGTARFATGLFRTRSAAAEAADRAEAGDLHQPRPLRPATRFNRGVQHPLTFDLVTLPLTELHEAKAGSPFRVTINDLMLTTVSLALAAYLSEKGELPTDSLAAMVPMSMRKTTTWTSANQLCQMYVDLHTDIPDPIARLRAVNRSASLEKQRNSDPAVLRAETRVETSPAWLLRLAGWARAQRSFETADTVPLMNTTISNVPPVATDLEFLGRPVARIFGVLPTMDGDGLRHLITSQGNEIVISVSTDTTMMADLPHYGELLRESFYSLRDALVQQPTEHR